MGRRALGRLRGLLRQLLDRLRAWARWVWHRITGEPGYAEALADLAVAVADLFLREEAIRRLVHQAARAFAVTAHSLLRGPDEPSHLVAPPGTPPRPDSGGG